MIPGEPQLRDKGTDSLREIGTCPICRFPSPRSRTARTGSSSGRGRDRSDTMPIGRPRSARGGSRSGAHCRAGPTAARAWRDRIGPAGHVPRRLRTPSSRRPGAGRRRSLSRGGSRCTGAGVSRPVSTSSLVSAMASTPDSRTALRTTIASNQPQRRGRPVVAPYSPPSLRSRSPRASRRARSGTARCPRASCTPWRCRRRGDELRCDAGAAGHTAPMPGVRRGDVGVGAVIDVEHRALGPLEQHFLARTNRGVLEGRRAVDHRRALAPALDELAGHRVEVETLRREHGLQVVVLVLEHRAQHAREMLGSTRSAMRTPMRADFVLVRRTDAATGGSDHAGFRAGVRAPGRWPCGRAGSGAHSWLTSSERSPASRPPLPGNALLGADRAIVTASPGTTRDAIEAQTTFLGWPIRLVDTAGLRESSDEAERLGVGFSRRYVEAAEVVIVCDDRQGSGERGDSEDSGAAGQCQEWTGSGERDRVQTKSDLSDPPRPPSPPPRLRDLLPHRRRPRPAQGGGGPCRVRRPRLPGRPRTGAHAGAASHRAGAGEGCAARGRSAS